jgi:hypothetical protein
MAASIVPPPRRRASPAQKPKKVGFAPSTPLRSIPVANPSSTAQRGRDSPLPVVGGRNVEKNANVHVCVFFLPVGPPGLPAIHYRNGAYSAHPAFRLPITYSVISPTAPLAIPSTSGRCPCSTPRSRCVYRPTPGHRPDARRPDTAVRLLPPFPQPPHYPAKGGGLPYPCRPSVKPATPALRSRRTFPRNERPIPAPSGEAAINQSAGDNPIGRHPSGSDNKFPANTPPLRSGGLMTND